MPAQTVDATPSNQLIRHYFREESRLLTNATPAIQDIVGYVLNTGSWIGEIFSLRWQNVDLERNLIAAFSPKTQKTRVVPINSDVRVWNLLAKKRGSRE